MKIQSEISKSPTFSNCHTKIWRWKKVMIFTTPTYDEVSMLRGCIFHHLFQVKELTDNFVQKQSSKIWWKNGRDSLTPT
jgi:hypothetical protein